MFQKILDDEDERKLLLNKLRAFSIHILTASGAFFALLAIIAVAEGNFVAAFLWLGVTLFIDGIDGPIARKFKVTEVLPDWSGAMIDNVIDYATYALIPAFALYMSGMADGVSLYIAVAAIVISSAVYYADMGMKTEENFFKGFPVTWNMLVFTLFATQASEPVVMALVAFATIMTFSPIWFLHPVRVKRLRPINLAVFGIWSGFSLFALIKGFEQQEWVTAVIIASSLYLFCIGMVLQIFPNFGKNSTEDTPEDY